MNDNEWYGIKEVRQIDGNGVPHPLMKEDTAVRLLKQAYHRAGGRSVSDVEAIQW